VSQAVRVVVLGAGRVGGLIALDLAGDDGLQVTVCDRDPQALQRVAGPRVRTEVTDLADSAAVKQRVESADVVVGAVPGALGHVLQSAAIEAGTPLVDISFVPEDSSRLNDLAAQRNVPVVVDCGVAPGLSNWFVGRSAAEMDDVLDVEIMVGGLPVTRRWPFEYQSVFSPTDVVEEYTRPCRMRRGGVDIVVPPLTEIENVEFERVGTLEAFLTDGLRSLLETIPSPTMCEKTLRYPGHADRMAMLSHTGFFDESPIEIDGVMVRPRSLTENLMFSRWEPRPGDEEFTVMRVVVRGRSAGEERTERWDLYDRTDRETGATSMARTTGFPCAIVTRMVADGSWKTAGITPPEILGARADLTERMLAELRGRGVEIHHEIQSTPLRS